MTIYEKGQVVELGTLSIVVHEPSLFAKVVAFEHTNDVNLEGVPDSQHNAIRITELAHVLPDLSDERLLNRKIYHSAKNKLVATLQYI